MLVYLRDLDAVSIRENVDWLESEDQLHIEHHIDPTLLLSEHQWQDVAVMPDGQDKYILSYFMQKNENAYSIIGEIKEKTKFKTYDISRYGFKPDCIDKALVNVGPEEFVGLFRNAQHVCTNSFHGLVFALIFNKSVDYIPIHRFSGRIEYLCKLLHLRKVPVQNGAYYHIEYDPAEKDRILEAERRRTYSYLEKEIGKAHDTNCR